MTTKKKSTIKKNQTIRPVLAKLKKINRASWLIIGSVTILMLLLLISFFCYEYVFQDKVYQGVYLQQQALGGKKYNELTQIIKEYNDQLITNGLKFTYQDKTYTLNPTIVDNADITKTKTLIDINIDGTAQTIYSIGRSQNTLTNLKTKLLALLRGQIVSLQYTIDRAALAALLENEFQSYVEPYQNATIIVTTENTLEVTPHQDGSKFVWTTVLADLEQNLMAAQYIDQTIKIAVDVAPVTTNQATALLAEANKLLTLAPITLHYEDKVFTVDKKEFIHWLAINETGLVLEHDTVDNYLDTIAGGIDVPVKEGKFSLNQSGDKITLKQFQEGQDGLQVNVDKTIDALYTAIIKEQQSIADLVVEITKPRASPDNLNELGVIELLGTGETNFAGSPSNRIYNINKGAELLNGLLIAPDEVFSLLGVLSPIDEAHGWKPELVIKEKKLKKEAGGGLCQVGTTSFRAAMLAGLPIVERRNHTWAVSYYSYHGKAGVDATIYEPSPDFKFKNDTGHYILWRSRVEGVRLLFELWGTSDGRKGYFTEPVNYGYASPGSAQETVDPNLPPGTRNCDSHVFTGVSASFDYIIDKSNGTTETTTFTSVYKPQAAVCIVGPPADTEPTNPIEPDPNKNTNNSNNNSNKNVNNNTNKNTNTNTTKNTNSSTKTNKNSSSNTNNSNKKN